MTNNKERKKGDTISIVCVVRVVKVITLSRDRFPDCLLLPSHLYPVAIILIDNKFQLKIMRKVRDTNNNLWYAYWYYVYQRVFLK